MLEADCFICHLKGYDYSSRAKQIKKGNFKWAATQASGTGVVTGAVNDKEVPQVTYFAGLFDPDGQVHLEIQRPDDRACMFCHTMSGVQKRGTAWHNQFVEDMHSDTGMTCVDCHTSDIRHNFAKGFSSSMTVRDDLDGTMLSCKGCHYDTKAFGAPDYEHPGIPPIHLERISCQACHITKRPFLTSRVVDTLSGKVIELPNDIDNGPAGNRMFGALWGTADLRAAAVLDPLPREILDQAAAITIGTDHPFRPSFSNLDGSLRLPKDPFTVRDFMAAGGDLPLADTADKRTLMIMAIEQVAPPNEGRIVACIFRGQAMQVRKGKLIAIDTNVTPRRAGNIAEYPVNVMYHSENGQDVLYPAGYQVSSFWAFEDRGVLRPLFVSDMQRAWDYLEAIKTVPEEAVEGQEALVYRYYPSDPPGVEVVPLPDAGDKAFNPALGARLLQYSGGERAALALWDAESPTSWPDVRLVTVYDDNNDTWPEVNTEYEMGVVAWAISRTMDRLEQPVLYFVKGLNAYKVSVDWTDPYEHPRKEMFVPQGGPFMAIVKWQWDEEAENWGQNPKDIRLAKPISTTVDPVDLSTNPELAAMAQRLPWTISHGVEPSEQARGANGCTDCHSMDNDFWFTAAMVDPINEQGEAVSIPAYELLGYTRSSLQAAAWREQWLKPFTPWIILAVLAAILIHFTIFGSRRSKNEFAADTPRFSFIERTNHMVLMTSVAYLSVTGFCFMLGIHDPLGEMSRSIHALVGYAAAVSVCIAVVRWVPNMLPQKGDVKWLLHMGGYLGGKGHYPAHKFNAGQKILFWKAMGLMGVLVATGLIMALNRDVRFPLQQWVYFVHDLAALGMIVLLLGHVYLGVFVNPHSVRSLFGGKVNRDWAKEHHPDWQPEE